MYCLVLLHPSIGGATLLITPSNKAHIIAHSLPFKLLALVWSAARPCFAPCLLVIPKLLYTSESALRDGLLVKKTYLNKYQVQVLFVVLLERRNMRKVLAAFKPVN